MKPEHVGLAAGFTNCDVGLPALSGAAKRVGQGWDIVAGGADIWEKADQFHFVYRSFSGDFDIAIRAESFTPAHLYSKAGIMVRENLKADSPHLMFLVFANDAPRNNNLGAYEMQFRATAGGDCRAIYPAQLPPAPPEFPAAFPDSWLRVQRTGDRYSAFASTDGKTWKLYAQHLLALTGTVMVGLALTSHDPLKTARVAFRDYREFGQGDNIV